MVGSDRQQTTKLHDEKKMRIGCRIAKARIKEHNRNIYYLLIFHCNDDRTHASQYYAIRT